MSGPHCPHGALTVSECPTCRAPKTIQRKSIPELRHILETHTSDLIFTEYFRDLMAHYERLSSALADALNVYRASDTKTELWEAWADDLAVKLEKALHGGDQPPEDMIR